MDDTIHFLQYKIFIISMLLTLLGFTQDNSVILGNQDHSYRVIENWGMLPNNQTIGPTHGGIVVDKDNNIYVSTDGNLGTIKFSQEGKFLKSLGAHTKKFHGLNIFTDNGQEFICFAGGQKAGVMDLEGNIQLLIEGPKQQQQEAIWKRATAIVRAPNGDLFIADGYGSSAIFKYDSKGQFLMKFGGKGRKNGTFRTSHGLTIDTRDPQLPKLVVCDRENRRLQFFTLEGKFITVATTGLKRPCAIALHKDLAIIAELEGRIVLLDKDYQVLTAMGENSNNKLWAKFGVAPKLWQTGEFTAPHGCAFDHDGNIYIQDWNRTGRITKLVPTDSN